MQVSSENLNFKIALLEVNLLKPHEEVVENLVHKLSDEMEAEREVRDPLIVDEKDHVILDGMHRFAALKKLRCCYAPCCLIDYDNPEVKVEPWFRVFDIEESEEFAERLLQEFDVKYMKERNEVTGLEIILVSGGIRFTPTQLTDDVQRARRAVELEKSISGRGYIVEYQSSTVAIQRWRSTDANFVIPLPGFSKQRIRKLVGEGMLLPHKATCHIIPSRPLRLDVPLALLRNEAITPEIANSQLTQLLSSRKIIRRPSGSVIDGRRYEEELLIFAN